MSDTIELHHVQVLFGAHVIAQYTGERENAHRYAVAMDRRFPGLKITDEIVPLPGNATDK